MTVKPEHLSDLELEICLKVQLDNVIISSRNYVKALTSLTKLQEEQSKRLKKCHREVS